MFNAKGTFMHFTATSLSFKTPIRDEKELKFSLHFELETDAFIDNGGVPIIRTYPKKITASPKAHINVL